MSVDGLLWRGGSGRWVPDSRGLRVATVLVSVLLVPTVCGATNGGPSLPAIIEDERLTGPVEGGAPGLCVMTGAVRNPNAVTVTVRLAWRIADATGTTLGLATGRVARLGPGQRRAFVASPFIAVGTGQVVPTCEAGLRIERIEVAAEASP